jgi:hypothetical protein
VRSDLRTLCAPVRLRLGAPRVAGLDVNPRPDGSASGVPWSSVASTASYSNTFARRSRIRHTRPEFSHPTSSSRGRRAYWSRSCERRCSAASVRFTWIDRELHLRITRTHGACVDGDGTPTRRCRLPSGGDLTPTPRADALPEVVDERRRSSGARARVLRQRPPCRPVCKAIRRRPTAIECDRQSPAVRP